MANKVFYCLLLLTVMFAAYTFGVKATLHALKGRWVELQEDSYQSGFDDGIETYKFNQRGERGSSI